MSKWEMVKLGEVCEEKIEVISPSDDVDIDYVDISSINNQDKKIISFQTIKSKEAPSRAKQILKKMDILVSTVRPNLNAVAINDIESENIVVGSTGYCVLRCKENADVNYIFNFCKSKKFIDGLVKVSRGASYPAVSNSDVKNSLIPLPPLETQKHIAKTLDTAAELLVMRKQQLVELDMLVKSIFYDMFGDPVTNEKGWIKKRILECCSLNPRKSEIDVFTDEFLISFVSMSNVSEDGEINTTEIRKYKEVKAGFTYFYENDVLFAKITPCMENGKGAIARNLKNNIGFGSTEFHVLRPIEGVSNSEWLFCLTALPIFRKYAEKNMTGSAGQKRVPTSFFDKFSVAIPPIELQTQFATIVTKIEEQKSLVKKAIDETQYLFDSLMAQYFE